MPSQDWNEADGGEGASAAASDQNAAGTHRGQPAASSASKGRVRSILIVGGGIGGLTAALAMARRGFAVRVLEQAPAFAEIGAGLQLGPNATRILSELGLLGAVTNAAVVPQRIKWMDAISGEHLTSLELGASITDAFGAPYVVMHRSDLLDVLLEACTREANIALETGQKVVRIENGERTARAVCEAGAAFEADLLIGADGLKSKVREYITSDAMVCSQYVAYRGAVPAAQVTAHAGMDNVMLWSGPRIHLVQYPLRQGEYYNQVAVFKSDRYDPDSDDWGTADELDRHFAGACEFVQRALLAVDRSRRWPMTDRAPIQTWVKGRVALLGDAAHPMLQYLAQGACQAMEDGVYLAEQLSQTPEATSALAQYESYRKLQAARVQITARFFGEVIHASGVAAELRDSLLRARPHDDYSLIDWLYRDRAVVPANLALAAHG